MTIANKINIFDRGLVRQRRARAAGKFAAHNFLFEEIAAQMRERLEDFKKKKFEAVLDISPHAGTLENISAMQMDFNDEEILPVAPGSFDLIVSNMALHWVNDLPGALIQIRNALRPSGLFMAALPGGRTLFELRSCLMDAELAVAGGASPRLSPTIELPTATALMQRAGFELPVTDAEIVTLTYPDILPLMRDLRGMGESNAHQDRLRHPTRRTVFEEAAKLYRERFANDEGRITATFEIIFLHGWKG